MSQVIYSTVDGEQARRQLRVSLFLILAMALGAFLMGFVGPTGSSQQETNVEDDGLRIGRLAHIDG